MTMARNQDAQIFGQQRKSNTGIVPFKMGAGKHSPASKGEVLFGFEQTPSSLPVSSCRTLWVWEGKCSTRAVMS
jgi:hypothetical protein